MSWFKCKDCDSGRYKELLKEEFDIYQKVLDITKKHGFIAVEVNKVPGFPLVDSVCLNLKSICNALDDKDKEIEQLKKRVEYLEILQDKITIKTLEKENAELKEIIDSVAKFCQKN